MNHEKINELHYVNNKNMIMDKYDDKQKTDKKLIPFVAILIYNLKDNSDIIRIIDFFLQNGGDLNTTSIKGNITGLSAAIDSKNVELAKHLLEHGASVDVLTEEDKEKWNSLEESYKKQQEEKENAKKEATPIESIPVAEPIPTPVKEFDMSKIGQVYKKEIEPEFWKTLFRENELFELRTEVQGWINDSCTNIDECEIVKMCREIIPKMYIAPRKPYEYRGVYYQENEEDYMMYNKLLCVVFILYGILGKKMDGGKHEIVIRGGKSIQMMLLSEVYETEDIDVVVCGERSAEVSKEVSELMVWLLGEEKVGKIEVKESNIMKVSYKKLKVGYKALSDIGNNNKDSERGLKRVDIGNRLKYKIVNIGVEMDEKLLLYMRYVEEYGKKMIEGEDIKETRRMLEKFKKGIIAMNKEIKKRRKGNEREEMKKRIEKIIEREGYGKEIEKNTMKMLYPGYLPPRKN
jgi:hypothetical protein